MQAWAAEAGAAHGAEPFYATPEFWVAVAFIVFVGLTARTIFRVATVALDERAEGIRNQIDEAQRLAEEAQELLASYERTQRDAEREAEAMVDNARREADRLAEHAARELERSLKRREQLAVDRIAQAEKSAIEDVRAQAVEVAMQATRIVLAEHVSGSKADALIDAAIKDIPEKLH